MKEGSPTRRTRDFTNAGSEIKAQKIRGWVNQLRGNSKKRWERPIHPPRSELGGSRTNASKENCGNGSAKTRWNARDNVKHSRGPSDVARGGPGMLGRTRETASD